MSQQAFILSEIQRRMANIIRVGVVEELDEEAARVRVRIGSLLTAPLPWLTRRAGEDRDWWAPEPGEQVVVLAPSGELAQGYALPAVYRSAYPAPADARTVRRVTFADGSICEYDREAGRLYVQAKSEVTVDAPDIRLGSSSSSDPVVRRSDLQKVIDDITSAYDIHTHTHPNGATGAPVDSLSVTAEGSPSLKAD